MIWTSVEMVKGREYVDCRLKDEGRIKWKGKWKWNEIEKEKREGEWKKFEK